MLPNKVLEKDKQEYRGGIFSGRQPDDWNWGVTGTIHCQVDTTYPVNIGVYLFSLQILTVEILFR